MVLRCCERVSESRGWIGTWKEEAVYFHRAEEGLRFFSRPTESDRKLIRPLCKILGAVSSTPKHFGFYHIGFRVPALYQGLPRHLNGHGP